MSAPSEDSELATAIDGADRGAPAPASAGPPTLVALERRQRLRQLRRGAALSCAAVALLMASHWRGASPAAVPGPGPLALPAQPISPVLALASRVQQRAAEGAAREVRELYVRAAGGNPAARGHLEWLASTFTVGDEGALAAALLARLDARGDRSHTPHPRAGAGDDPRPEAKDSR